MSEGVKAERVKYKSHPTPDPEHPHTLEELQVVKEELVEINASDGDATQICVSFNPTVPHCSLATLIGLCMRVKLQRELPSQCKVQLLSLALAYGLHCCTLGPLLYWSSFHCLTLGSSTSWSSLALMRPRWIVRCMHTADKWVSTLSVGLLQCDMVLSHNRRAVNKQVNDKERVCAALENPTLLRMVEDCIRPPE